MQRPWFHLEAVPEVGGVAILPRQEARHATGSRRLGPGDQAMLFDGQGTLAEASIAEDRDSEGNLQMRVKSVRTVAREQPYVELCASLPKGDRLATMLDMCTQAGMDAFRPLECARSVIKASAMRSDRSERWGRIFIEACKQSARPWQPTLAQPLDPVAAAQNALEAGHQVLVAEKGGTPIVEMPKQTTQNTTILVGPEGGFTQDELGGLGELGTRFISLGRSIYRIEAAAVVSVATIKMTEESNQRGSG